MQVIACPHCQGLASYMTLLSGNTFGAVLYSDGKQVAPMLPAPPPVVKCEHCNAVYWMADAREMGMLDDDDLHTQNSSRKSAKQIVAPTDEELYAAIDGGMATSVELEKQLRILAWWKWNDRFRKDGAFAPDQPEQLSAGSRRNLEALAKLVDEVEPGTALLKAEALRQLGEFGRAEEILRKIPDGPIRWAVSQIRAFCDRRDISVRPLEPAPE
jgi:hypothetical protein